MSITFIQKTFSFKEVTMVNPSNGRYPLADVYYDNVDHKQFIVVWESDYCMKGGKKATT